jgi:hypothetical protein
MDLRRKPGSPRPRILSFYTGCRKQGAARSGHCVGWHDRDAGWKPFVTSAVGAGLSGWATIAR